MNITSLTRFTFDDEEVSALYEVCAASLDANLLDGYALAFALAIVETLQGPDDEPGLAQQESPVLQ